jgi:hypothetical protein
VQAATLITSLQKSFFSDEELEKLFEKTVTECTPWESGCEGVFISLNVFSTHQYKWKYKYTGWWEISWAFRISHHFLKNMIFWLNVYKNTVFRFCFLEVYIM